MHYQVWDMGIVTLHIEASDAWGYMNPDYLDKIEYLEIHGRWGQFVQRAHVGDIFRLNAAVYVVKLGSDWNALT